MCAEETVGCGLDTGHHITVNNTTALNLNITLNQRCEFLTNKHLVILGSIHLTTGKCYGTGKVNCAILHQTTNEDYLFGTQRPNHLTLVDGRNMINLYTYITSGSRTIENINLTVLGSR